MQEFIVDNLEDENDGDFSAGDLSLREAIALANETEGTDTITFDSSLSAGTIALTQTQSDPRGLGEVNQDLTITDSVSIIGLGADSLTIDGVSGGNGIFKVTGENTDFNLEGITVANGTQQRFFRSDSGGAGTIDFNGANLTLKDSVIIGGNGVFTGAISNSGNASISGSTITDSSSTPPDGSFATGVIDNGGTLEISNSTISNNSTPGILNRGDLEVFNSTIGNNNQDNVSNNSGSNLGSEITSISTAGGSGTANITSSIISGNSQQDSSDFDDLSGEFTSGGNNLIGDGSGGFVDGENGDLVGTSDNPIDPLLGELQNNGGSTPTQALQDDSPAINAGSNPNNLATDQRGDGFDRTIGSGTDIGAFEVQADEPVALVVSTLEDENDDDFSEGDLSLREAIAIAETGDTITFNSNLSGGTINLNLGDLTIDKSLTIQGLGADQLTIDAGDNFDTRVFEIDDGNDDVLADVNINGLTITGGSAGRFFGSNVNNIANAEGGGISNAENLRVENSVIRDNTAILYGGGIYNSGRVFVANSTITGNNITGGGSPTIGDGGGLFNRGIATVDNSTVTNNVGINTGGIQNNSSRYGEPVELFIRNSTITGNSGIDRQGIPEPFSIGAGAGVGGNDRTAILSSIVANNETDVTGDIISDGNNLIGNGNSSTRFDESDLVGTPDNPIDPQLGELQNNGGTTPTQALLEGSPAIDTGRNRSFDGLITDQRGEGFDRTVGEGTDIGSFELQTVNDGGGIPDELVVSTLEDESDGDFSEGDLSLREAIAIADRDEVINFDSSLSGGTITLTLGELAIDKSLDIRGLGANNLTIDGNNQSRIFNVRDDDDGFQDDVSIDGLTLANGNTGEGSFPEINGGAILNHENLLVTNTALIGNRAGNGGAIFNVGQIQLDNSLVAESDGTAPLFNDGGTAIVSNSTFTNNVVAGIGAIANTNGGTLDLTNSTLANNSGYDFVLSNSDDSTATVTSTIIANNEGSLFPEFSDAGGTFVSGGNNLIGNNNGAAGFDNSTDLVGTTDNRLDARLGELQDNGGATQTLALLEDSPAIDAGSNPDGLITDQRGDGFDRTIGNSTDIGAFELQTVTEVNEIVGTDRGDVLEGTEDSDRLIGLDGNDTIRGLDGDDTIEGNNGNDSLEGGTGNDSLIGMDGFDSLFGGTGDDTLDAGSGNDSLDGGAGNDLLFGLGDRDTLLGGDGDDFLDGGAGVDFLDGGTNNDSLFGGLDNDSLRGGSGDDFLDGGAGIDSLEGGAGQDVLLGADGNDSLFGGNGDDLLDSGAGNDSLRGDDGNDIFVLSAGNGTDFIVDFNRGHNLLGLSSGISFADLTFSGNDIILGDETLATLNGFNTDHLTESSFTHV